MKTGWPSGLLVVGGTAAGLLGLFSHSHPSPSARLWEMFSPRTSALVFLMLLMLAAEILALLLLGDRLFHLASQWIGRLAGIPNALEAIALLNLASILFSFLYLVDYWGWTAGLLISGGICLISAGLLALIYRAVPAGRLRTMGGKVAATLIGFGLASGTAEIVLRKLRVDAYRLQPALLKWQSLVAPGAMRGVTGVSHPMRPISTIFSPSAAARPKTCTWMTAKIGPTWLSASSTEQLRGGRFGSATSGFRANLLPTTSMRCVISCLNCGLTPSLWWSASTI
jgi:hypothetical protein